MIEKIFFESMALIGIALQSIFAWALWSLSRAFVKREEYMQQMTNNHSEHRKIDGRIIKVEQRLAQLPDNKALGNLTGLVLSVRGDIKAMDERISGLNRLVLRLEQVMDKQEDFLRRQVL